MEIVSDDGDLSVGFLLYFFSLLPSVFRIYLDVNNPTVSRLLSCTHLSAIVKILDDTLGPNPWLRLFPTPWYRFVQLISLAYKLILTQRLLCRPAGHYSIVDQVDKMTSYTVKKFLSGTPIRKGPGDLIAMIEDEPTRH